MTKEGLNEHMQSLSGLLYQPWLNRSRYSVLHDNVDKLVEAMHLYVRYLEHHSEKVQAQHRSPVPIRQTEDFSELRTFPPRSEGVQEQYSELNEALSSLPLYKAICLNDFAPGDSYQKKVWLSHLALPYPIKEYRYAYGNQLGTVSFVWKITEPEDESSSAMVLLLVTGQLKTYTTRAMKQLFISKYSCIAHPSKAVLRSMFRDLVHDSSSARTSEEATVDERVALALLNADDTDIILDLRKLNGKPNSTTFDAFWE